MINQFMKYSILFVVLIFKITFLQAQSNWELQKDETGIKVYSKNAKDSGFKPFKAVVIMDNTVEEFVSVLFDINNMKDWIYKCKHTNSIERKGDTIQIYYAETKVPFPYKDRYGIYKNIFKWNSNNQTLWIAIETLEDYKKQNENLVRIKGKGYWQVKSLSTNKIEVTFMMEADPGGGIPAWMANMFVNDSPYYTLLKLKDVINKTMYKNKTYDFID